MGGRVGGYFNFRNIREIFVLKVFVLAFITVSVLFPLTLKREKSRFALVFCEAYANPINAIRAKIDYEKALYKGEYATDKFIAKAYNKLVDILYHEAWSIEIR